jgi:hypothetical protein
MRCFRAFSLIVVLVACFPATSPSVQGPDKKDKGKAQDTADEISQDERILRQAKLAVDGPALLQYFRDRTYKEADPKFVAQLIKELGDVKFPVREKAYAQLLKMGNSVLGALKEAANHPDEETRKRAAELRLNIEKRADPVIQAATARLIGARKPEGAAEVLLAYLPFAADDTVIDDVAKALQKVAVRDGKVEKVVVEAAKDKLAVKRGAAAAALARTGIKEHVDSARELLKDPIADVRLRVAMALVLERDKAGIGPLINCLKELGEDKMEYAEDLLVCIAGQKAPLVDLGTDEPSRLKCFMAWNDWWKNNEKGTDLAKVDFNGPVGSTVVVYMPKPMAGKVNQGTTVCEFNRGKKVKWKFHVPTYAVDAVVVGPNRVLIAERNGQRISERDFNGNIKWEKNVPGPVLAAQRLANGNTFVVLQNGLYEYDSEGKEVFGMQHNMTTIFRGRKLTNGDVVYITNQGLFVRMDKTQKQLMTFKIGQLNIIYGNIEELPNGNLLTPLYNQARVAEYDNTGKQVSTLAVNLPVSAQRLPNGNTLVASYTGGRIVELDNMGREVWNLNVDAQVIIMARKR